MAKVSKNDDKKPKSPSKKHQTVRERAQTTKEPRRKRVRQTASKITTPIKKIRGVGKKEYHPLKLKDHRLGRLLNKRVRIVPKFVRESWQEIRLVTWPNARQTFSLTMAVFIFSVVFAVIVGVIDYGLDKLFREVIIGK